MTIRLGLVDSGVSVAQAQYIHSGKSFSAGDLVPDPIGHGTDICNIICHHAPDIEIYNAQVFDATGVTTARAVAAAIDWLVASGVDIINLSLGLVSEREILREACGRAVAANVILIAASPARGVVPYPAAYTGVIQATGDARCDIGDISFLNSAQADFGGCVRGLSPSATIGGASLGAAHISGRVAVYLKDGGNRLAVRQWLVRSAKYIHNEHRTE